MLQRYPTFQKAATQALQKKKIEIFNVHEYGSNGKKHWHLICFNHDFLDKKIYTIKNGIPLYQSEKLEGLWTHGFCTIGDVTEASAMYQAQYTQKDFKHGNSHNSKKSKSNHSGIGKTFFESHYRQILRLGFIPFRGSKKALPRYFEKLAHKHWAYYNDPSFFHDLPHRKALYRPFKKTSPNPEISHLFDEYMRTKRRKLLTKELKWQQLINKYRDEKKDPEFMQSLKNAIHDLETKTQQEIF